jgi:hypothetical protein
VGTVEGDQSVAVSNFHLAMWCVVSPRHQKLRSSSQSVAAI